MINGNLLIVDDHKQVLDALEQILEAEFSNVYSCSNPNSIPNILEKNNIDLVLLDMNFSAGVNTGNEGIFWLNKILETDPDIQVVMITAYGEAELAVKALKNGALDFISKPWDNEKLIATLQSAFKLRQSNKKIKKLQNTNRALEDTLNSQFDPIIGESTAIKDILKTVDKVAATDANILITGENGTGKDLIAREIHKRSNRSKQTFISIDLGLISESLFESELFGHKKGAFTDAKEDKKGKFELASGGTLFLDEIGNLSYAMQAKLLTVLQSRIITPVGSNDQIPVDIRLICATNRDIKKLVRDQIFREDLLFRINTIHINLPKLNQRVDDIPILANYFLDYFKKKYDKMHLKINNQAFSKLEKYSWPGNIRELKHSIEKSVILSENDILTPNDFMLENPFLPNFTTSDTQPKTMEEIEKAAIINALKNNQGNVREAARELDIARQTMYNKITKYNI